MSPQTRRPTGSKKGSPIHVRLDEESEHELNAYAKQENVRKAEAIKRGIAKIEEELRAF